MKKLSELLCDIGYFYLVGHDGDPTITHLTHNSNTAQKGSLFFALPTTNKESKTNTKQNVMNAIAKGAVAVVVEKEIMDLSNITQIVVKCARTTMSLIAKAFNDNVCDEMNIIGITGTNGKTTTSHIIFHILSANKIPCGIIGTLGTKTFPQIENLSSSLTTPDPIELHEIFAKLYSHGIETVVMECSAHAIALKKLCGIQFKQGIFTNLSMDHLDFFGDYRTYADTKINWFGSCMDLAIVNSDDAEYSTIRERCTSKKLLTYGLDREDAHLTAFDIDFGGLGTSFKAIIKKRSFKVATTLKGRFNVYNTLSAIMSCQDLGLKNSQIVRALKTLPQVPGRFNTLTINDKIVIIDYAHTPDSLEQIITTSRELVGDGGKLITLFGCGGNRDIEKRSIMGEISTRLSDSTIITSDNPRDESPMSIMLQIEAGAKLNNDNYILIENRKDAIYYGVTMAKKGDVLIIAGKGAEDYQEIKGKKIPFSDYEVVTSITTKA